jgi:hypothetical protein
VIDPATFLTELKRRKAYRVAVAYAIVAWLLIQAPSILFPSFEAPAWVIKVFVTAMILGFPVAAHFIRERFPPPVVTITRFITTSIVS